MKSRFTPTLGKVWISALLVALACVPNVGFRQIVWGFLALPYVWIVGHPPFPYHDKPWFISPAGALSVAAFWAVIGYFLLSLMPAKKEPIQPQETTHRK